ncbi:MAG TPA: cyclic nucleotide-binding domain-containing protein [Vicinamibacteria bacterium]|nr:cyclic nucleotide-binding domain-containing protein [Vicinamibacteria bacterium]
MPYTVVEKVLLLQNVDVLSAARTEDLAVLASITDEVLYQKDAVVFEEGQPADGLYVVVRGELVLTRNGQELSRMGAKSALGAWDLIEGSTRVFGSHAATETLLLRVDRQDFYDLLLDYPELGPSILKALVRRFRKLVSPAGA